MTSDFWLECGLGHNIYRLCLAHSQRAPDQGHSVAGPSTTERSLHGVFGYFRYQSCGFPAKRCHHTILLAVARVSSLQHHLHRQQSHQEFFSEWGNLKEKSAHFVHIFMYAYEIWNVFHIMHMKYHLLLLFTSVLIGWFWQAVSVYQCVAPTPFFLFSSCFGLLPWSFLIIDSQTNRFCFQCLWKTHHKI